MRHRGATGQNAAAGPAAAGRKAVAERDTAAGVRHPAHAEPAGLTPKAAARVIRFDRTRRLLQRQAAAGTLGPLADVAAECGYYDQAHLAREFSELAGCPPSTWLAQECRNVQAAAGAPARRRDHARLGPRDRPR